MAKICGDSGVLPGCEASVREGQGGGAISFTGPECCAVNLYGAHRSLRKALRQRRKVEAMCSHVGVVSLGKPARLPQARSGSIQVQDLQRELKPKPHRNDP
eukprot:3356533-Amphidinium_carterae.1